MRSALGWVLILLGGVWILQGADVPWMPQSYMTADWRWIIAGSVAFLVGLGLVIRDRGRKRDGETDVS